VAKKSKREVRFGFDLAVEIRNNRGSALFSLARSELLRVEIPEHTFTQEAQLAKLLVAIWKVRIASK
jgi:hypothetical protein